MKNRKSYHLTQLLKELRKRALQEEDEEKRRDYWRLFFKAQHAEHEVRTLVMDAEIRRLLDFALAYGRLPDDWRDEIDQSNQDKNDDADTGDNPAWDDDIDDDDIPPRQKGLWE